MRLSRFGAPWMASLLGMPPLAHSRIEVLDAGGFPEDTGARATVLEPFADRAGGLAGLSSDLGVGPGGDSAAEAGRVIGMDRGMREAGGIGPRANGRSPLAMGDPGRRKQVMPTEGEGPSTPELEDPGPPAPELVRLMERLRAGEGAAGMVDRPDMLATEGFAARLGITPEALDGLRREGKVLCVDGGRRGDLYPAWQVGGDGRPVPGLTDVVAAFTHNAWAALRFLAHPLELLDDETPLEWLRRGEVGGSPAWRRPPPGATTSWSVQHSRLTCLRQMRAAARMVKARWMSSRRS